MVYQDGLDTGKIRDILHSIIVRAMLQFARIALQ
jgi:hypothetical protein